MTGKGQEHQWRQGQRKVRVWVRDEDRDRNRDKDEARERDRDTNGSRNRERMKYRDMEATINRTEVALETGALAGTVVVIGIETTA